MTQLLKEKIKKYVSVEDKDLKLIDDYFKSKAIAKGTYILKSGEVFHSAAFVQNGLFRTFIIDENGAEHIIQFASQGLWTGDLASFISRKPSKFYTEALEDAEILTITKEDWEKLLQKAPFYLDFHRKLLEKGLFSLQERLLESYSVDATKKYLNLIQTFPDILQRVPQYMIASYLGMSRETLSRVRKHLSDKK